MSYICDNCGIILMDSTDQIPEDKKQSFTFGLGFGAQYDPESRICEKCGLHICTTCHWKHKKSGCIEQQYFTNRDSE